MESQIRTRFAPSPTGYLHLGSLRTALFNYLWARKNKGLFILRLEDTDQSRLVSGAAEACQEDLRTLGLDWDFGPDKPHPEFGSCIQSQRLDKYRAVVQKLLDEDIAYLDYTKSEDLQNLRQQARQNKKPFVFKKSMSQTAPQNDQQKPVVRISVDANNQLAWQDIVKGQQRWRGEDVDDFVILKSDGWPTYHLANVVDDHLMVISHVIRADEWLSSTPKHLCLYSALGWQPPTYIHVPPVLTDQGDRKLSKREGSGQVASFLQDGYLPEALLNYISFLGWNPKTTQEIFNLQQLVEAFRLEDIQASGARFDPVRLDWFNGRYIRALPDPDRSSIALTWWSKSALKYSEKYRERVLDLVYERLKKWSELPELTLFFFETPIPDDATSLSEKTKLPTEQIQRLLTETLDALEAVEFKASELEVHLYQLSQRCFTSPSRYFKLLRLILTGREVAPSLFATMDVLGLTECQKRLSAVQPSSSQLVLRPKKDPLPPPGFLPAACRQDPCDPDIGLPPAQTNRCSFVYQNLDTGLILKTRPLKDANIFKHEIAMLQIAAEGDLPVPKVCSQPTVKDGWVSYMSSYIKHQADGGASPDLAARVVARMHAIELGKNQPLALNRHHLSTAALGVLRHPKCPAELAAAIKTRCLPLLREIVADMQTYNNFIHGDLHLGNILPSQPEPSLIDFEHAGRGSPIYDIARVKQSQLYYQLDADWCEAYIKKWHSLCSYPLNKLDKYIEYYSWGDALHLWLWVHNGFLKNYEVEAEKRLNWILRGELKEEWIRPSRRPSFLK